MVGSHGVMTSYILIIKAKNPILAHIYHAFDLLSQHDKKRVWFLPQRAITVHPLGGARVGNHQQDSVVNAKGQVHGHRHLYVSDGSALPSATGTPPSMTLPQQVMLANIF